MIFGPFKRGPFPSADEDAFAAQLRKETPQTRTPSYKLAFQDDDFLLRDELRPVRLQLELLKPELLMREQNIDATVVIYGSARVPEPAKAQEMLCAVEAELEKQPDDPKLRQRAAAARYAVNFSRYYEEARTLGRLISTNCQLECEQNLVVMTGGGPGIMEAANRGAYEVDAQTIGLNIVLPFEQAPNPYITPDLSFQFHYFAIRKMHLLMRAKGLVAFPGGFGTMDELFETLTLIQTGKVEPIPVLLFGREFWNKVINFEALVEAGTIAARDLKLFQYVETAEEAWTILAKEIGRNGKRNGKQVTKAEM
ncbi:TIGR00730 family Rossman fold protein [Desulfocurvibacter africanus]|uniref:AMP nucleosidase n=1 Tax=Desulfocurvibacter africanus subsp. africanus str. Walvis Bay TaxID=690850 RepID=F3Z3Q6_DESAF|nr:TIGR00730 family Rossman fold protein [Desulfocurvibacter africanus]EGJ51521.1 Conserved hypothetical protein CHP00730 [Desulfocurvibacter africanus subsp. africanus str. Walvis Bay]